MQMVNSSSFNIVQPSSIAPMCDEEIALITGGDGISDTLGGLGLAGGTAAGAGAYFEIGALVIGGSAVAGVAAVGLIGYGIYEIATSK